MVTAVQKLLFLYYFFNFFFHTSKAVTSLLLPEVSKGNKLEDVREH